MKNESKLIKAILLKIRIYFNVCLIDCLLLVVWPRIKYPDSGNASITVDKLALNIKLRNFARHKILVVYDQHVTNITSKKSMKPSCSEIYLNIMEAPEIEIL